MSEIVYAPKPVAIRYRPAPNPYRGMAADGYTTRSGAVTSYEVQLTGDPAWRWRRLMCWQFSNIGTVFVRVHGKCMVVCDTDLPFRSQVPLDGSALKIDL